jgi:hypothetical protein
LYGAELARRFLYLCNEQRISIHQVGYIMSKTVDWFKLARVVSVRTKSPIRRFRMGTKPRCLTSTKEFPEKQDRKLGFGAGWELLLEPVLEASSREGLLPHNQKVRYHHRYGHVFRKIGSSVWSTQPEGPYLQTAASELIMPPHSSPFWVETGQKLSNGSVGRGQEFH